MYLRLARYSYGGGRYGMVRTVRYDWYGTVFPGISDTTGIGMSQVSAYSRAWKLERFLFPAFFSSIQVQTEEEEEELQLLMDR